MRQWIARAAWGVLLCAGLAGQEVDIKWKSCPKTKVNFGKAKDLGPLGHWLKKLEWRCGENGSAKLTLVPVGFDEEGSPRALEISAELGGLKTPAFRRLHDLDENYPLFSTLDVSVQEAHLGDWKLWSVEIAGTTNGDPPNYFIWLVEGPKGNGIALGHGLGRGLMGFREGPDQLELLLQSQGAEGPSIRLQRWLFSQTDTGTTAEALPSSYLFILDGGSSGVISIDPIEARTKGVQFYAREISELTERGGVAAPSKVAANGPLSFQEIRGWKKNQDHYTSQYWGDFHWAWDLTWAQGPVRQMVKPDRNPIGFRWANTVHIFEGKDFFEDAYDKTVGPRRAGTLASRPGWGVVLVHDRRAGPVAVGLVAPEWMQPKGGP